MIQDKINNALTAITFLKQQEPEWKEKGRQYILKSKETEMARDVYKEAFDQAQFDRLENEARAQGEEIEEQPLGELKKKQAKALNYERFINANPDVFGKEIEEYEASKDEGMFADLSHVYDKAKKAQERDAIKAQEKRADNLAKKAQEKRQKEIAKANTEAFAEWVKSAGERGKNPYAKT